MKWSLAHSILCLPLAWAVPAFGPGHPDLTKKEVQLDPRAANALPGQPNYTAIPNGQTWYDTSGNPIVNVGGGFLKVDSWYYWIGQAFSDSLATPPSEALVNLYKSQDLMNWDFVGDIINVRTPDVNGVQTLTYCFPGRPKLLYNEKTNKYVAWVHWEMTQTFSPSQIFVATADNVEGPYTVTEKGHFRPGAGNQEASAMGDRVGGVTTDYNSSPKDASNTTRPLQPVSGADYPRKIQQYNNVNVNNPEQVSYLSQSNGYGEAQLDNYWTYDFTGVVFNLTLKVVSVRMTPWDMTYYNKYSPYFSVSTDSYSYIVRYPTTNRSEVSTTVFTIGDPGNERAALVQPEIRPGLDESSSTSTVYVHSGDAAFITCNTTNGVMYYTTDGTTPTESSATYWTGTRISVTGSPGNNVTVKAICALNNQTSSVVTQTYTIVDNSTTVPIFRPIVNFPSGTYTINDPAFGYQSVKIYCPTYNTECYYTTDGYDPDPPVLGTNIGYRSRDFTVWQDPKDSTAYLISASDNVYFRLWQLTDDYTDVVPDKEYDVFTGLSREAPALIRNGGASGEYVYMINSMQTGWYPNQGYYTRTGDITAGFSFPRDSITGYRNGNSTWAPEEPIGDPSTFGSQSTYILDIGTEENPQYIYVGDRNVPSNHWLTTSVFMPLTIDDDGVALTGDKGTGLATVQYTPFLTVDMANNSIVPSEWKLLSLNKPVDATPAVQLTAAQIGAGTYNFSASVANDGIAFDLGPYDDIEQFYMPQSVPFYWTVDLGQVYDIAWVGLSFMSVGGSDAANRYTVTASTDGSYWWTLVTNLDNTSPGWQDHVVSGSYRYIKLNDYSVFDIAHNKEADWEVGVYEVYVYGSELSNTTSTITS
jgi:hypothetical protein